MNDHFDRVKLRYSRIICIQKGGRCLCSSFLRDLIKANNISGVIMHSHCFHSNEHCREVLTVFLGIVYIIEVAKYFIWVGHLIGISCEENFDISRGSIGGFSFMLSLCCPNLKMFEKFEETEI